jgi:pSer/pThr/pTyr-binding forkhead associated (FHA) protein
MPYITSDYLEPAGRKVELVNDKYTIGSDPSCDLVISHRTISKHHCTLVKSLDGHYSVVDGDGKTHKSLNRTFLNNQVVIDHVPYPLKDKDLIILGVLEIEYSAE